MKQPASALVSLPMGSGYRALRIAAGLSVPVILLVVLALALAPETGPVYDSPLLLFITNTLLISISCFVVAYVTARAYLESAILRLLLIGSGALLFGLNSLLSGVLFNLPGGLNTAITTYNVAALVAGLLHLGVAFLFSAHTLLEIPDAHRHAHVALAYVGVMALTFVVILTSSWNHLPPFFIQGLGATPIRQIVLGSAIVAFSLAAVLLVLFYVQSHIEFHYWYALALAMTAVGLAGVFLQSAGANLLTWSGRFAQQLGGVYLGVAILTILHPGQLRGIALEMRVSDFFRDAEANYQALVETATDAIISVDRKGHIVLWNPGAERMFGYTREQVLGRRLAGLIFPDMSNPNASGPSGDALERLAEASAGRPAETIGTRQSGEQFPIEYTVSSRSGSGGSTSTLVMRDITERKQTEREIARLNRDVELRADELELANKELESFAYSVSHDLRAPLASIRNLASMVVDEHAARLPPDARSYVELIRDNSAATLELVEGLLELSRSIRQPVKKQAVDLRLLVEQAFAETSPQREGRSVELIIDNLAPVEADPLLLKQVLVNLLSNAVKFTRHREVARIEVGVLPFDSRLPRGLERSGPATRMPVFYVRDNGVGFSNEDADKLFTVFHRLHPEEEYEGTGVGLAIVERIIRRHGGRVGAEGEPDRGASFYFTLG